MSRRVAHRPHHHLTRPTSRPLPQSQRDYLRHRWVYRQQSTFYARRQQGYGLSLIPWGWRQHTHPEQRRRA